MTKYLIIFFFLIASDLSFGLDEWNQKSQLPAIGRHRGTGMAINDKGYIGLGHMNGTGNNIIYSDWWEFDPATNSWTQKADFPVPNYGASSFTINNKGYVGGGTGLSNQFYEFNPMTNQWIPIQPCLNASPSDDTAFGIGDYGYVKDGNSFYEYSQITGQWTQKAFCPLSGWAITSFVIQDKGFVKVNDKLVEYKPSVDAWTFKADFPGLTTNGGKAFSIHNKGFVLTGYSSFLNPVNSEMWAFDPADNSWTQVASFPGTSRRFGAAFAINNKGYFGTGTNGTNMNDFWEYNPALKGVGIEEETDKLKVSVYPNPSNGIINFELENSQQYSNSKLLIYDCTHKLIETRNITANKTVIYKNNLSKGLYFYNIVADNEIISIGKFIFN